MSSFLRQVKELLSRNLDAEEIAHRLHAPIGHVVVAINQLNTADSSTDRT